MSQETFAEIWNKVLLYAPDTPVALAQTFVKNAYKKVLVYHPWSELRRDAEIHMPTSISDGTIDLVPDTNTIQGHGTSFTTDMVGLQIAPSHVNPWYTITAVDALLQILTIDRKVEGPAQSGIVYEIGKYYVEFPDDLGVITSLRNSANTWVITPHYRTQEYLNRIDARRMSVGTPVVLVAAPDRYDTVNNVYIQRYELWPRITGETSIILQYYAHSELSAKDDRPIDVLYPETLVHGALMELAMWPGTAQKPNPFHDLNTYTQYKAAFEAALHDSEMRDINLDQRMINYDSTGLRYPIDAKFFQNHPF